MADRRFQAVLQKDENVGAAGVVIDPTDSSVVYATLWEAREGPWENGEWNGTNGGIYKSTDGGQDWQQLSGGLPAGIIEAYVSVSASNPRRLFASVATGDKVDLYRSDDAGATWTIATNDPRPRGRIGGGDLCVPIIDPKNPDVMYVTSTVTWKSVDGGKTWTAFRGAPGGDDYQNIWINPNDPKIILIASDQGAIITVNGGESWSSWYNQSDRADVSRRRRQRVSLSRCAAASRRAARLASGAAATTARSPFANGIPWLSKNMATSRPIRSIPTSSMAAR